MRTSLTLLIIAILTLLASTARAELPAPPDPATLTPFPTPWGADVPGLMSAADLLDAPAGRLGPVVARDGHFYTGEKRLKLWGVNFCFAADFPTHEQADRIAPRLARFGINAVRFHHMDNQPFPSGIFADKNLETLSPEALDRLDYFIAALKKQGIYSDLNLHVSRFWTKAHNINTPNIPGYDKIIDLFDPALIAAQKQYARDLLTHLNPYTKTTYAAEPAVALVEINNENTFFLWGGQQDIADLPEPYSAELRQMWNTWLTKKYATREKLLEAWSKGITPAGENLLQDPHFATLGKTTSPWILEQHEPAQATASLDATDPARPFAKIDITAITGTNWHLQFQQPKLALKRGTFYTLKFTAKARQDTSVALFSSMAHEPWTSLGLGAMPKLTAEPKEFRFGFTAAADDNNARISFSLGSQLATLYLADITLVPGGQTTLDPSEDPAKNTVAILHPGDPASPQRSYDWHDFLQQSDEAYFTAMRTYLKDELHVQAPITGTIGLGALGTLSQSKMDYVDAHNYWDHPQFPRRSWDNKDWLINNKPMVDSPTNNALFPLAATRVHGKPFTVTEYNHSAPNEYAAETIPELATFAALQDWDAVFLFAYSHNSNYQKDHIDGFFDIEGNPAKLAYMPAGARIFLGNAIRPLASSRFNRITRDQAINGAPQHYDRLLDQLRADAAFDPRESLSRYVALDFKTEIPKSWGSGRDFPMPDITWSASTPGTGRFVYAIHPENTGVPADSAVFVGFAKPNESIPLKPFALSSIKSPFLSAVCVPAEPVKNDKKATHYLLTLMGRAQNTAMTWNEKRTSVSDQWGKSPALVETIDAALLAPPGTTVTPLDPTGQRRDPLKPTQGSKGSNGLESFSLTDSKSIWFELTIP